MQGFVADLEKKTKENEYFRQVLYTAAHCQLVVMAIQPGDDIGMEVHPDHDQFIRIESGSGKAVLNGEESPLTDGSAVIIPAGAMHNIINTGSIVMKLYTVYSPPEHADGTVHKTKAEAVAAHNKE